jgi:hypothetical protein
MRQLYQTERESAYRQGILEAAIKNTNQINTSDVRDSRLAQTGEVRF